MSEVKMQQVMVLASNGLETLGLLLEVGTGVYEFAPKGPVYFYDTKQYDGPNDPKLVEEVNRIIDSDFYDHPTYGLIPKDIPMA